VPPEALQPEAEARAVVERDAAAQRGERLIAAAQRGERLIAAAQPEPGLGDRVNAYCSTRS